jgi:hypothetical protein
MAYLLKNVSGIKVIVAGGVVIDPGEERPFTEVGTKELDLQRAGLITISRPANPDDWKDDARYVEVLNLSNVQLVDRIPPDKVGVVNLVLPIKNTWYLVSLAIPAIRGWKLKLRRTKRKYAFDYAYVPAPITYMTCLSGETIFHDTSFTELYIRVPDKDGLVAEFEYWTV